MPRAFRALSLNRDQLCTELIGEPRDDLVLHVEKIGQGLVKPISPQVLAGLGFYQLYVDTNATATTLNRALEDIANAQPPTDLFNVDELIFVSEGRVARDHERATDAG